MVDATNATSKKKKGRPPRDWKERFLAAMADTGIARAACHLAGVNWATAYRHRNKNPKFAEAWDEAHEQSIDLMEVECRRIAMKGESERDRLLGLFFLLKANRPEKYRDNYDLKLLADQIARAQTQESTKKSKTVRRDNS